MNTRSAFLLAAALLLAPSAHAQQDPIKLENIRAHAMTPGLAKTTIDLGNDTSAVSDLRGFKITLSSSHTWTATTEPIHVTATIDELNDVTVPFQQRPQVRWTHGKNN